MIKIDYTHPRKLHEIKQVHADIKTLVSRIALSKQIVIKQNTVNLSHTSQSFIDYLNDNGQAVLDALLISKPDILANTYIKDIESQFPDFVTDKAKVGKRNQTYSEVREVAYTIFVTNGYEKLKNKAEIYSALAVDVCPYCNRSLIAPIDDGNGKKTAIGELDHYYCKSRYPYLAVSLYNLVPSCGICNGKSRKGEKDLYGTRFQNPYLLTDNDGMSFGFKPTGVVTPNIEEGYKKFHIKYLFAPNHCLKYNFDTLKLKRIYSGFDYRTKVSTIESVVRDFCNQSYIDTQVSKFQAMGFDLTLSSLIRDRLSVSVNKSEYSKNVDNKFVMDVFNQMVGYINQPLLIR